VQILYFYLTLLGAVAKNETVSPLAGMEPAALRFRCSASTNWTVTASSYLGDMMAL
jgi:hypothetical protein